MAERKSLGELQEAFVAIMSVDAAKRKALANAAALGGMMTDGGAALGAMVGGGEAKADLATMQALSNLLPEVATHDNPAAVKAIQRVFRYKRPALSMLALRVLATMSNDSASKAISKRTSFFSFADAEEKTFARALSAGEAGTCAGCKMPVAAFSEPAGMRVTTLGELAAEPGLRPYHGLVCDECGAVTCLLCSGKKATELQVSDFVCTGCDNRPLKMIFR